MKNISLYFFLFASIVLKAQQPVPVVTEVDKQQLTFMVVPYTSSKEIIKDKIENSVEYRLLITRIGEAVAKKGYTLQDYSQYKKLCNLPAGPDKIEDILECAPSDVHIVVEMTTTSTEVNVPEVNSSGQIISVKKICNEVILNIRAIENYSADILAQVVIKSGCFYTNDWDKLVERLFKKLGESSPMIDGFVNDLDKKYQEILTKLGRSVAIKANRTTDSEHDFNTATANGSIISDEIYEAANSNPKVKKLQPKRVSKDVVFLTMRLPLTDEKGNSYTFAFWKDIRNKVQAIKLKSGEELQFVDNNLFGPRIQINIK